MSEPLTTENLVARLKASAFEVEEHPHPSHCDHLHNAPLVMREAVKRIEALENALRWAPCSCTSYGTASIPPQPTDHMERHWCSRCLALGYDKNPEPKPVYYPFTGVVQSWPTR